MNFCVEPFLRTCNLWHCAMADEDKFRVAMFDGKEFDNWFFRLKVVLDEKDLLVFIENDVNV